MKRASDKSILPAIGVITGTAIGAGFLGIPYVISKSGFIPGVLLILIIACFVLFLKLCLGEVILRTKGNHQLPGYAEKYLGKKGKILMFVALILGIFPALIAYLIAEGETLSYFFTGSLGFAIYFSAGFWILMAFLSYIGLKALKKFDRIGLILVILIVALIFAIFAGRIQTNNLIYFDSSNFFLPIGVILFSFLAFSALPEVARLLRGNEKKMKKTIVLGILIPLIVYIVFTFVVIGTFGKNIPEIAVLVLGRFSSFLAVFTLFTAFFTSSIAIRDVFRFDFKTGRFYGWVLAVFIPLILFVIIKYFNLISFVELLSFAGIISGGLTGVAILIMNVKAKKLGKRKPEYTVKLGWTKLVSLSLLFIAGISCALVF